MRVSMTRTATLGWRGLRNSLTARPLSVSFEVTHCCNARCKHCHLGGPREEQRATPERLGEICRELSPVVAQISGGEPLLRRDLEDIVRAFSVSDRPPVTVVTTNGALLTPERWGSLRAAGLDEFSLSLDYPDERHDEFRGIPGLFARLAEPAVLAPGPPGQGRDPVLCDPERQLPLPAGPRRAGHTLGCHAELQLLHADAYRQS